LQLVRFEVRDRPLSAEADILDLLRERLTLVGSRRSRISHSGGKGTVPAGLLKPKIAHRFPVKWKIIECIKAVEVIDRQVANLIR
jgi:hypothetical protein